MWLLGQAELVKVLAPKYIRDYVDQGVDGTYGVISFQGSVEIGGEDYKNIKDNDCDLTNMDYSFFKDLSSIE